MKKTLFLGFLFFVLSVNIFSYEYIAAKFSGVYSSPTNQVTALSGGNWNDGHFDLALSTAFYYYGRRVTHIRIMTDGYVIFGFGGAPTDTDNPVNNPIPNPGGSHGLAAPWWDDWDLTTGGSIWYNTNFTVTIVEWRDIPHHNDSTAKYRFKLLLYSSSYQLCPNTIIFSYDDMDSGTGAHDKAMTGTIGLEHYAGYQGEEFSYNTQADIWNGSSIASSPFIPIYDTTDFWMTGKPDLTVFRPSNGVWFKRKNDGLAVGITYWGTRGDIAVPGDYDGDTTAEECVVRPGNFYYWFCQNPSFVVQWGKLYDIPVPADYDGDGTTDIAVFRPNGGYWFIYYRGSGTSDIVQWGAPGDIPLPADYDGDGKVDCAIYRSSTYTWFIRKSANPSFPWIISWGTDGDIPFPAKTMNAAYANICIYRPSDGFWFSYDQFTGTPFIVRWGIDRDLPVLNDWESNGLSNYAVFRPSEGNWFIVLSLVCCPQIVQATVINWGTLGDKPRCRRSRSVIAPPPRI